MSGPLTVMRLVLCAQAGTVTTPAMLLQVKLKECEAVLENDYFLAALKDDFVENARLFIFETYCRIHQCIDMRMLAGAAWLLNACCAHSR